jgi:hypothetical protein
MFSAIDLLLGTAAYVAAMLRQDEAHCRQLSAHRCICGSPAPIWSQSWAQRKQMTAQAWQVWPWKSDPRSKKSLLVPQI